MTPDERAAAAARGAERMEEARQATGNLTCDLTVTAWQTRSPSDIRPITWAGTWRPR